MFLREKDPQHHEFPISRLYLHLENWKPFSLLACLPVPYGMDNNAGGGGLPGNVDDSILIDIPWAHTIVQASQKEVAQS